MGQVAFRAALLIAAFAALLGTAAAAPATDAVLTEIQAALDKGDARQAQALADAALGEQGVAAGERGRLLLYRGLAQELLGDGDKATADFTAALDQRGLAADDRAQALLQRGFLRDGQGRLAEASADYTAVIALKAGGVATALNNRANILRRQNRLTEARRDYLAALSGGRSQYSYYGLGQIAEAQHDILAARGFYARAVAADPGYALASQRLAALGGAPEGVIPAEGPVVLKPPPVILKPPPASPSFTPAPGQAEAILLRPPASRPEAAPVVLKPPRRARAPAPAAGPATLRPALDAPRAADGPEVQLGAWRSEAEARTGWTRAKAQAGAALAGLAPHIVTADIPGRGRYFRLRTRASGEAAAFCARLMAKGLNCFPARD